jgi:DNA helicase-2/ATP-dependent DNA helicase PcrA
MDLLRNATDSQREAITHVDGPLLVLAGAGSGKTLVITRRIAHLIGTGVPPEAILAITFTNKAAGEMRDRVEKLTNHAGVWISTFHSLAARLLRRHIEALGFTRDFTIYDTVDQADCVKEAMRELEIDTTHWRPSAVSARISHVKNMMTPPDDLEHGSLFDRIVHRVHRRYAEILRENNALDFDDLLLHVITLFEREPALLEAYRRRFRHVLIDEYQDTNRPQYLLARSLGEGHGNICATGDPDQSIYRWRGADIHNILNFERDFPGTRVVKLEENFRSTGLILKAASSVIAHNRHRKRKGLWTRGPAGEPVRVVHVADDAEEAREVTRRIREALQEGRPASDIAVFFRTNAFTRSLERSLIEESIPYTIVGTVEFFERREIKDVLSYLRVRENPSDRTSLERIVNVPRRGIGARAVASIRELARERGISVLDAMRRHDEIRGLNRKTRAGIEGFLRIWTELRDSPDFPVGDLLRRAVEISGYDEYLAASDTEQDEERRENVAELIGAGMEYDRRNPDGSVRGFLEEVALLSQVDRWESDVPRVTLMTLHAAKGLEFPVVFVVGLEEGVLPHHRSIDSAEEVEEERRLLHVGMTRARERLVLLHAAVRAQFGLAQPCIPSRFLEELPEEAVERERRAGWGIDAILDSDTVSADGDGTTADFSSGERVKHPLLGVGTVVSLSGHGEHRRVVVRFENGDERKFILEFAKLSRLT